MLAAAVGAACWAPLGGQTLLAPLAAGESGVLAANLAVVPTPGVASSVPGPVLPIPQLQPTPAARPTAAPPSQPIVIPTLGPTGKSLMDGVHFDLTAQWVKNHTETALRSGPSDDSQAFTLLPQWSTLERLDSKPDWLLVQYGGDGATREPGPGWVKATDVGAIDPPTQWLKTSLATSVWSASDASGSKMLEVPVGTAMEVLKPDAMAGTRMHVRLPGDGRQVPPTEGWMDADALARRAPMSTDQLPRAYPEDLRADVRINAPYRTQLDGSAYAGANCGPTALGMALESLGVNEAPDDLRRDVLRTETFDENDDDAGSYIWALARVVRDKGFAARGLYDDSDGGTLHHWSVDEVRSAVHAGHLVIAQVVYRGLPGRQDSEYYGDHYIVITGLIGDNFLYNDPIGGPTAHEAPGYDRVMSAAQLERAMRASDSPYAYTAFSISRS